MRFLVIDVPTPQFKILKLSDLHYGNKFCNESAINDFFGMVDDNTRIHLDGDLFEAKIRKSKGKLSDQIHTPGEQLKYWKRKLSPFRNQIDELITGNHEEAIESETELNIVSELADDLGCYEGDNETIINPGCPVYDDSGIFVVYRYTYGVESKHTTTFSIYSRHGSSGAALPGGKLNAAYRGRFNVSANVIFTGHVHTFTATPGQFIDPVMQTPNPKLKWREQWTVTNGSCLDFGGYGERGGYSSQPIVQTMIYVDLAASGCRFTIVPVRPGEKWR